MGAWGEEPEDNDRSADMFGDVMSTAHRALTKVFRLRRADTDTQWERLGVLQKYLKMVEALDDAGWYPQAEMKIGRDDIDDILDDKEWLSNWKSPAKNVAALKKFRTKIERMLLKT